MGFGVEITLEKKCCMFLPENNLCVLTVLDGVKTPECNNTGTL